MAETCPSCDAPIVHSETRRARGKAAPFLDVLGRQHLHDPFLDKRTVFCAAGHRSAVMEERGACWCGWSKFHGGGDCPMPAATWPYLDGRSS